MSENTKALIARKAAYDYLQTLDDDEDVIANFHDHHEDDLAARFQTAIDEATADLRTQLADAQAQLAAAKAALRVARGYVNNYGKGVVYAPSIYAADQQTINAALGIEIEGA